jgi:mRNA degradation ribonuclease J1/J2
MVTMFSLLQPNTVSQYHVHNEMLQQKKKQQFYYNQGTKDLQPLKNGDVVRIQPSTQTNKEWKKGTVAINFALLVTECLFSCSLIVVPDWC